ncbi:MAG TPA: sulfur carrier protein ThiS, partial [Micropepsaceae bacterium]
MTVEALLTHLALDPRKVAVERNLEIVPRSTYAAVDLSEGDRLEIVHFIGGGNMAAINPAVDKPFVVAGRTLRSRLIVGTGKYKDYAQNAAALEASGAEMVTVALRRVNVMEPGAPKLIDFIDPKKYVYLPNTAGCFT